MSINPDVPTRPFLRRVTISNYKSIGKCDVHLGPFTVLVGRNGAGKSNFLDALRFVADGLQTTLEQAIRSRGGIDMVRRKSTGHPRNFAVGLEVELSENQIARYEFGVKAKERGGFAIRDEFAEIVGGQKGRFKIRDGQLVEAPQENMVAASTDRLYLVQASGYPAFRTLYERLASMGFYNLNPQAMKELQSPDAGELLQREGGNIASVIARLARDQPAIMQRIQEYLATIVPNIAEVERAELGPRETLQFKQKMAGAQNPWKFYAANMSDGTLRSLGNLVAVTQLANQRAPVSLVGLEEPETALHPAAISALMDALREAAVHTQIVVTTHSPDLLDEVDLDRETVLAVVAEEGKTRIAPIDEASRKAIENHLYTPGEMLRLDQLGPDEHDLARQEQIRLFSSTDEEEAI
jgi:predicted ATPase